MPLFLALWHCADIALDVNQSRTYYEMAYNVNGTYREWAIQYQNATNSTYLEKVSPWYFYTACGIWIGPPLLSYFFFTCCKMSLGMKETCCSFLFLPIGAVIAVLNTYIWVPLNLLCNALLVLFVGQDDEVGSCCVSPKFLRFMKFLEILGEAIPQLTLNYVFMKNNYPYLVENDTLFSIPVPVSVISAVFSLASVFFGFTTLGWSLLKELCCENY